MDNLSVVIITFKNFTTYLKNIKSIIANQPSLPKDNEAYNGRVSNQRNFLPKQASSNIMPNIGPSISMQSKRYGMDFNRESQESGETNFESEYHPQTIHTKHTRNGPAKSISTDHRSYHFSKPLASEHNRQSAMVSGERIKSEAGSLLPAIGTSENLHPTPLMNKRPSKSISGNYSL